MNGKYGYTSAPLKNADGELTPDPSDKVDMFLDQFYPLDDISHPTNPEYEEVIRNSMLNCPLSPLDIDLSYQELLASLSPLPLSRSALTKSSIEC